MAYREIEAKGFNMLILENVGDQFEGKIKEQLTGHFGPYWILVDKDGVEFSTPSHKVLVNRLNACKNGDQVRITKLESIPPTVPGRNATTMYKVEVSE